MIYFLQEKGNARAPVKIGFTKSGLYNRIQHAQFGYPFGQLAAIGVTRGSEADEGSVHWHWADLRMRGEWFAASDDLLKYIAACSVPCWTPALGVTLPFLHAGRGLQNCGRAACICQHPVNLVKESAAA